SSLANTSSTSPGSSPTRSVEPLKQNWARNVMGRPSSPAGHGTSAARYGTPPTLVTNGMAGSPRTKRKAAVNSSSSADCFLRDGVGGKRNTFPLESADRDGLFRPDLFGSW